MENLIWSIFNAEDENQLHDLVMTNPYFVNNDNWFPYGGLSKNDRTNFGTFESQQPHPIPALVEKITNSIDSLLMKKCRLEGIDPKSSKSPRKIAEAVEKYFGIKNCDFSEVSTFDRRNISENIQVIATGNTQKPNILIYDNGEGQHPADFDKTFLSLRRNNKTDIPFVQGKYNMGSTGAVVFCGRYRYQLIASKLDKQLNSDNTKNEFGFTLIRRHPLSETEEENYGSSWYEYFLLNGEIPRFPINELDVGLWNGRKFVSGSLVKLYSYQLPLGSKSDITLDLWRDLNQYLYSPALPILLYEKRFKKGHSPSKPLLGNKTRIIIDERDKKEQTIQLSVKNSEMGEVNIEATVFKHGVKQREFIGNKAIVFTLNGQVHGSLHRSFISQSLGLQMLRDSLLINIDCTKLRTSFRQDLFMANRCNLKNSETLQVLLDKLIDKIKSNEALKDLNQNRKNRIIRDNPEDKDLIKSLMESIPLDKDLLNLLKKSGNLNFFNQYGASDKKQSEKPIKKDKPHISERFPSIFKINLKENSHGKKVKSIPLNGKGIIRFETDVEDEYLFRPKDRGELQIQVLGIQNNEVDGGTYKGKPKKVEDIFEVTREGPTNNTIKITFEPKEEISVGDEIEVNAKLTSPDEDLESIFYVKIVDPQKESKQSPKKEKEQPSLPQPIRVFEKKDNEDDRCWDDMNPPFSGEDIVRVIKGNYDNENIIEAIAINMDSFSIRRYMSKNLIKSEKEIKFAKDKYFSTIYLHSLFLYSILDKLNKTENEKQYDWDIEELIPSVFKPYSNFLLYSNTDETILSSLRDD